MHNATFVMFMVILLLPMVMKLLLVLIKMKRDDPQTMLCLSDSMKGLFTSTMRIFGVRVVEEVLLGIFLLVALHCAVSGFDIGIRV